MSRHAATLLLLALAPGVARALEVVAPRDGGVVLGAVAPLEVADASTPPQVRVDGALVTPTWIATGARRWFADVPLGAAGAHTLEVWTPGRRARVAVTNALTTSVDAGDLVLAHLLASRRPDDLAWGWGPAVLLYGVDRFGGASALRSRVTAFVADYQAHHLARGLPKIDHPDRCPPALTALSLARAGDPSALPNAEEVADYLRRERRNVLGAIDHLGSRSLLRSLTLATGWLGLPTRHWAHSIWLDSLFMYALFAAQWGTHTGDPALADFGLAQPAIFARVLQDPRTGLLRHAWDVEHARPIGSVWLRGNGWVAAAIVDLLDEAPASSPRRAELEAVLRPLAQGLLDAQDAAGLWPTLLDRPTSYQEASGAALAAYALAKGARLGVLPASARERARPTLRSLTARLRPRPSGASVTGTSVATNAWHLPALYTLTPRRDDVDWGVGSYLLLAHELRDLRW